MFVAIDLPASLRESLAILIAALRRDLPGLRWVKPEGIHLTLKFLGDVPEAQDLRLREVLHRAVPSAVPPFDVRVEGVELFPDKGRPRVVWTGLREVNGSLLALQQRVEGAAKEAGFPAEGRPFKPHLTLARMGEGRPASDLPLILARHSLDDLGSFRVSTVCLFQSILRQGGAEYRHIEEFHL
jgi:2'-5' RNA ligase